MKKVALLLLVLAALYGAYEYLGKGSPFEVRDSIVVSQASGLDVHAGNTAPLTSAVIKGVIKNTTKKNFANLMIVYTIGYDSLSTEEF